MTCLIWSKQRRRGRTSLVMARCLFLGGIRRGWEGSGLACHTGRVQCCKVMASSGAVPALGQMQGPSCFPLCGEQEHSVRRGGLSRLVGGGPFEHSPLPALPTQAGHPKEGAPKSCMVWRACGGVRDRLAGVGGSSQTVPAEGGPGPEQQQGGAVVLSHTEGLTGAA